MNYLHHPNLLTHFWTSVNSEFEKILNEFVKCDGWLFQDLGVLAKKADIGGIYRCASTTVHSSRMGKSERLDHFYRVIVVILDAAKTQWLCPWRVYVEKMTDSIPPFLKRQIGGFFLLYMLYISQPLADRFQHKQRIIMDRRDIIAMHVFNATMQRLPKSDDQLKELGRQLVVLFNDLVKCEAFEMSAFNDTFITPNSSVRKFLSTKYCDITKATYTLKDVRDQLHFITYQESLKVFRSLVNYGRHMKPLHNLDEKEKCGESRKTRKRIRVNLAERFEETRSETKTEFPPSNKEWTLENIKALENENDIGKIAHCLPSILKSLDMGPVLTRKRLTGCDENVLSKEVAHCVDNFEHHQNSLKVNHIRRQQQSRYSKSYEDEGAKPVAQTIWKDYFTDNYAWIEKIVGGVDTDAKPTGTDNPSAKNEDEGDDGWVIDEEDDDIDDVCSEDSKAFEILEIDNTHREASTPNKKIRVPMNMPSI